jgi:hypothetical protein
MTARWRAATLAPRDGRGWPGMARATRNVRLRDVPYHTGGACPAPQPTGAIQALDPARRRYTGMGVRRGAGGAGGHGLGACAVVADDDPPEHRGQRLFALQPAPRLRGGEEEHADQQLDDAGARAPVGRTARYRMVAATRARGCMVRPGFQARRGSPRRPGGCRGPWALLRGIGLVLGARPLVTRLWTRPPAGSVLCQLAPQ